jgi:hypothetical protein
MSGLYGSDLRDTHLIVAQELEQKRLELLVGPVDLVYQEHRRLVGLYRLQDGTLDEEVLGEEDVFLPRKVSTASRRSFAGWRTSPIFSRRT